MLAALSVSSHKKRKFGNNVQCPLSFFFLYIVKKVHKIGTPQADLIKDYKSALLLLCSSSARSSTYKDQGCFIWNTAQTAGNSVGCNELRNTKDSYISYTSFINFN